MDRKSSSNLVASVKTARFDEHSAAGSPAGLPREDSFLNSTAGTRQWAAPRKKPSHDFDGSSATGSDSTDVDRMVPRAKTQMNLAALAKSCGAQKSSKSLVRSKTYPDPLMSSGYKFSVADPFRRDRQIQTLGENVEIEQFYDLGSLIGEGGFGAVKESTNASTLQTYAVKVVQKSSFGE